VCMGMYVDGLADPELFHAFSEEHAPGRRALG
jgi:hypothetical protein